MAALIWIGTGLAALGLVGLQFGFIIGAIAGFLTFIPYVGALVGGVYAAGKMKDYKDWVTGLGQFDVLKLLDVTFNSVGAIRGEKLHRVVPYVMDLGSSNGTCLNGERLKKERYYELREKDMLTFALSTREYVVMRETQKKT